MNAEPQKQLSLYRLWAVVVSSHTRSQAFQSAT
jgi:hypothetical protein